MYATTALLALLSLTPLALAQSQCQLFVTGREVTSVISSNDPFAELTRDCAVSPQSGGAANNDDCATLGFLEELDFDGSMVLNSGTTGLNDDVEVRIFRDDLTEGFLKTGTTDLNFQGDCEMEFDDDDNVESIRCEFGC